MSLSFTLKRNVSVRCFDLVATVAREEKRAEIAPVLAWAEACAARGRGLDPAALASELLGPGAGMITVAKRLLYICRDLRLLNDDLTGLTDDGTRAAQSGNVLQPEKGEWTIWACEDPLVEFPIVGVAPKALDANGNGRETKRRDSAKQRPAPMPGWVQWAEKRSAVMLADGRLARFDEISAPAIESETGEELQLLWTPAGSPEVRAVGVIGPKSRVDQPLAPTDLPSREQVWSALLEARGFAQRWDAGRAALRIPFKAANTEDEKLNMRTQLTFPTPAIGDLGEFQDVTVPNVGLCPDSDLAASEWAGYQMKAQLAGVQTMTVFDHLSKRVRASFDGWKVQIPSREALARELAGKSTDGSRPRAYWSLQSALDWNL